MQRWGKRQRQKKINTNEDVKTTNVETPTNFKAFLHLTEIVTLVVDSQTTNVKMFVGVLTFVVWADNDKC